MRVEENSVFLFCRYDDVNSYILWVTLSMMRWLLLFLCKFFLRVRNGNLNGRKLPDTGDKIELKKIQK